MKALYPPDWGEISQHNRFERVRGRCDPAGRCERVGFGVRAVSVFDLAPYPGRGGGGGPGVGFFRAFGTGGYGKAYGRGRCADARDYGAGALEDGEDGGGLYAGGRGGARGEVVGVGIVNDDGMRSRLSAAPYQ